MNEKVTRPSAAENCAWVRDALARRGADITETQVNIQGAIAWLAGRGWADHAIWQAVPFIAGRPGRMLWGDGWRLSATTDISRYDLIRYQMRSPHAQAVRPREDHREPAASAAG